MKIVFLSPFGLHPKGTLSARLLPLAEELISKRHSVVIIAPPYTNPEASGTSEQVGNVCIRNVKLGGRNTISKAILLSWRMFQTTLREKPFLVHLFKPKGYGGLAAMLLVFSNLFRRKKIPLFVDTDDWEGRGGMNDKQPYSFLEKRIFHIQERWLSGRASGVSVASRTLQTQTWGMGVSQDKVLYLPNSVHTVERGDGATIRKSHRIGENQPVVLLYTRFLEFTQKRLHRIFRSIAEQKAEVRFLIVGKGRCGEEDKLVQAAGEMGFSDNLVLAGWVVPQKISDYLASADVAIYPLDDTLVNRAKCPAKLTEIMVAGCPVVADRVGQAQEYIRHAETGFLVDPQQPEVMGETVLSLLEDKELRTLIGQKGREFLLENFSWRQAAEQLEAFYGKCLNSKYS